MTEQRSDKLTRRRLLGGAIAVSAPYILPASAFGGGRPPRLNIGCIGMGNQMQSHLFELTTNLHQNIVAICDVDHNRLAMLRRANPALAKARAYKDFRHLLENEKHLDAIVVATPDHWHAPICSAAMHAKKHVYCEKPLAHTLGDARRLRELSYKAGVVTQTGNHGSASANMRRSIELIQAGLFGQISEVHIWHPVHRYPSGVDRPHGEDPIPSGLDWDFWLGPSPERPYKRGAYHPAAWRGWYDFGGGTLADFCCHAFNLPVRALKLGYPAVIEVSGRQLARESFPAACTVRFRFARRDNLDPLTMFFYSGGAIPPVSVTFDLKQTFGAIPTSGCLMIGERGDLSAGLWNSTGHMRMRKEKTFSGINGHKAARDIPVTLPRTDGHMREWVQACMNGPQTFANFEIGGHLTEIGLAGVLALRVGYDIEWDGKLLAARDVPEANSIINPTVRQGWGQL